MGTLQSHQPDRTRFHMLFTSDQASRILEHCKAGGQSRIRTCTRKYTRGYARTFTHIYPYIHICEMHMHAQIHRLSDAHICDSQKWREQKLFWQVLELCTNLDPTLLLILISRKYSNFVRRIKMLALGVCFLQACSWNPGCWVDWHIARDDYPDVAQRILWRSKCACVFVCIGVWVFVCVCVVTARNFCACAWVNLYVCTWVYGRRSVALYMYMLVRRVKTVDKIGYSPNLIYWHREQSWKSWGNNNRIPEITKVFWSNRISRDMEHFFVSCWNRNTRVVNKNELRWLNVTVSNKK